MSKQESSNMHSDHGTVSPVKILISLAAITCLSYVTGPAIGAPIQHKSPAKAWVAESYQNGKVLVEARHSGNHIYETLLIRHGRRIYRVADERVFILRKNGDRSYFNDDTDVLYDHDFYFSPDGTWLFITRKLLNKVDVAYLYHYVAGHGFDSVRPHGMRFDEAALQYFAEKKHFSVPTLETGGRVLKFQQWAGHGGGLVFTLAEAKIYSSQVWKVFVVNYDLRQRRFKLIEMDLS
jgi:hypothetical protein